MKTILPIYNENNNSFECYNKRQMGHFRDFHLCVFYSPSAELGDIYDGKWQSSMDFYSQRRGVLSTLAFRFFIG